MNLPMGEEFVIPVSTRWIALTMREYLHTHVISWVHTI
jgi:hypothetical protein